jgi:hypothetical protein
VLAEMAVLVTAQQVEVLLEQMGEQQVLAHSLHLAATMAMVLVAPTDLVAVVAYVQFLFHRYHLQMLQGTLLLVLKYFILDFKTALGEYQAAVAVASKDLLLDS